MKTIIAGSRAVTDPALVDRAIAECGWEVTEVISGGARGVDQLGEKWAMTHGRLLHRFPADWKQFGRSAGVLRNATMLTFAEAVIVIWDGESRGSRHMIEIAKKSGKPIFVLSVKMSTMPWPRVKEEKG